MKAVISVVIPSYNEERYIGDCLNSLLKSDYISELLEIIIVDGMSEDSTRKIVEDYEKEFSNIILINNPARITPVALNIGILHAHGDYIMIASAHAAFSRNYIRVLLEKLHEFDATGVGGRLITKTKVENKTAKAVVKILSNPSGVGNSKFRTGAGKPILVDTVPFGIYKKDVFSLYGLYNEKLVRNHDIEWSKRIINSGGRIYLIPEVFSLYYARENLHDFANNNYCNGYWNIITLYVTRKFGSLSIRHYIPFIFLSSQILILLFSILFNKLLLIGLAVIIGAYLLYISYNSIILKDRDTGFFNLVTVFLVLHYSYGFGSIVGMFNISKLIKK